MTSISGNSTTTLDHIGSVQDRKPLDDLRPSGTVSVTLVARLGDPRGGTEIGRAIEGTLRDTACRDLLLITDGKSHALDVQALASMGHRISVLLVGEDSLEANVGHLAALTGGDLFVAMEADFGSALAAALASLRTASRPVEEDSGGLRAVRRGARLEVRFGGQTEATESELLARAAGALVAGLRLTTLGEEEAAVLAEQEGLVTHLTSLVLVDHDGKAVDDIPLMRKVQLPEPRTAGTETAWFGSPSAPIDMASLTPREERVLRMRFGLGMRVESLPEDARRQFSATRERIRQIEAKAQRKLNHPSRSRKLRSFLDFDSDRSRTYPEELCLGSSARAERRAGDGAGRMGGAGSGFCKLRLERSGQPGRRGRPLSRRT